MQKTNFTTLQGGTVGRTVHKLKCSDGSPIKSRTSSKPGQPSSRASFSVFPTFQLKRWVTLSAPTPMQRADHKVGKYDFIHFSTEHEPSKSILRFPSGLTGPDSLTWRGGERSKFRKKKRFLQHSQSIQRTRNTPKTSRDGTSTDDVRNAAVPYVVV